jgi:hypothetical protein
MNTQPNESEWRPLELGEIIQEGDEARGKDAGWQRVAFAIGEHLEQGTADLVDFRTRRPRPPGPGWTWSNEATPPRWIPPKHGTEHFEAEAKKTLAAQKLEAERNPWIDAKMVCGKCGGLYPIGQGFCGHCRKREAAGDACEWRSDDEGNYFTACGDGFTLTSGTLEENHYNYCPSCGRKVVEEKDF